MSVTLVFAHQNGAGLEACQQMNRATRSLVKAGGGEERNVVRAGQPITRRVMPPTLPCGPTCLWPQSAALSWEFIFFTRRLKLSSRLKR